SIQTADGIRYTRDGAFMRSSTGVLHTSLGEPVLDAKQQPITIPSGAIRISPDGSVSVTTQDGSAIVGTIGVFDFANRYSLTAKGTNRFTSKGEKPTAAHAAIQQGAIEGANQDAVHSTMQLVLVQRQA